MSDDTRINFTKKELEDLPLPVPGQRATYYDLKVTGLQIRVTHAGIKSFVVVRKLAGKPVRVTLGRYPDMTIEQARKAALAALSKMAGRENPNDEKKRERLQSKTLREAFEDYIQARKDMKASTVKDMRVAFNETFSDWMEKPLNKITRAMVEKRHRDFGNERSEARANLGMRYLRAVLNFAIDRYQDSEGNPLIQDNPVSVLKRSWFRVERRRTFLKPHEIQPWWTAVEALSNRVAADFFKLVLLTGLRREEALSLTWENVDLKVKTLTVVDPKNREDHTLPLSDYLISLLEPPHYPQVAG